MRFDRDEGESQCFGQMAIAIMQARLDGILVVRVALTGERRTL